jgi:signal peptidase I
VDAEPVSRQAASFDLETRIALAVKHQRRGRHAKPRGSRHRAAPRPPSRRLAGGVRTIVVIALAAVVVVVLRVFVVASFYIPSGSMEPTLHGCTGCQPDRVLVDKLSYRFQSVSRKDVVVFRKPAGVTVDDADLIKRVIGLPGDVISAHGRSVYVDNRVLSEPYVNAQCDGTDDFGPITVPPGRYFVMGDNRCDSYDSRKFGAIARSSIVGRAFAVIWPVKHLRGL